MKKVHAVIFVICGLIALHTFGNDNYEKSFLQMYVGICALIIALVDFYLLYGNKGNEVSNKDSIKNK